MPQLILTPLRTPASNTWKPKPLRITGLITNIWHQPAATVSSTSQHVYNIEAMNSTNTNFLIRLRYIHRDYHLLLGSRVTLSLPPSSPSSTLNPLFELPNISDAIICATSARIGVTVYPERDKGVHFEVLTPYNAIAPDDVFAQIMEREDKSGERRQMTFSLFAEWIRLKPDNPFVGYISGILMQMDLVGLWQKRKMYCMPCQCGNVVFANDTHGPCPVCSDGQQVYLRLNPQILASIADETFGFDSGHNLLVTDTTWKKLVGRTPEALSHELQQKDPIEAVTMLKSFEDKLHHLRLTFVIGWSGKWGGGRLVVIDVLD